MAIATPEQVHRYPRRFRIAFEVLCTLLVLVAAMIWARLVLQYMWDNFGRTLPESVRGQEWLGNLITRIHAQGNRPTHDSLSDLLPGFGWLAGGLMATLFIRNFFPTIRTSGRGLLIEWSNSWLPVGWEHVQALRVTEDLAGERFVLLLQTNGKALTGWHRVFSFIYRLGLRRGVVITSAISDFMPLVQTMLQELETVARQTSKPPVRLDERASSPLFQLLLSPAGFFSRRSKADKEYIEQATAAARTAQPGMVATLMATYPKRIRALIMGTAAVLAGFGLLRALSILRRWMGSTIDALGQLSFFQVEPLPLTVSTWWLPISAVVVVALLLPLLVVLRNLLPDVESRPQGLAVRYFNRWLLVPWQEITAVKSVELSENNHYVLIQTTDKPLTIWHRVSSLLFEGANDRGVILTSALSTFEPLMQQIVLEVSRAQRTVERDEGLLTEDAPAWLLRLLFKPSEAIHRLVQSSLRNESQTKINTKGLLDSAGPMLWLAALPTVILLAEQLINQGLAPSPVRLITALFFLVFCFLEWPLIAAVAQIMEQNADDDAHRSRPFYLYPITQLPRLLVFLGILILTVLGVPLLPTLLWLGGAGWAFLLTAGLWDELYGWSSTKLLAMGALPAIFQLLTLIAWHALS